jgi:hypothetical protein
MVHTYGEIVHVDFVNDTGDDAMFAVRSPRSADFPQIPAPARGSNEGYVRFGFGPNPTWCSSLGGGAIVDVAGPSLNVRDPARNNRADPSLLSDAGPLPADSEEIARAFLDAIGEFDADRAVSYLSDDAAAEARADPNGFLLQLPVLEAVGYQQSVDACVSTGQSSLSITYVRCFFELHALGSDKIGLGPYGGNYWDLGLRDGVIESAISTWTYDRNGFGPQVWEPFVSWLRIEHPDDVPLMYADWGHTRWSTTEQSARLWEQRIPEYVARLGATPSD